MDYFSIINGEFTGKGFKTHIGSYILEHNAYQEAIEAVKKYRDSRAFYSAWGLEYAFFKDREKFTPYLEKFIKDIPDIRHESVRREYGKILYTLLQSGQFVPSLEEAGILAEAVAGWATEEKAKIANKVWCFDILYLLSEQIDWCREILNDLMEKEMLSPSPGLSHRIKKIKALMGQE